MKSSLATIVMALGVAAIGVVLGARLIAYSEADDAPGGVVIGALIIAAALALGVWMVARKRT